MGIAQRLAGTRLLVTGRSAEGAETVELAHEALISGWSKLADWATEDRAFLVWRESLRHDRDRWERGDRAPELLPTTVALAGSQQWWRERGGDLSEAEREYLERGRIHHRSHARRRRALFSGLGLVMTLALVFGSLFAYTQQQSQGRAAIANSRALTQASENELTDDPALSAMLALSAYQTSPTQEARNEVLRQYMTLAGAARVLSGMKAAVGQFRSSSDGNTVLAKTMLDRATLFVHAAAGAVHSEEVASAAAVAGPMVSADGRRAAVIEADGSPEWFDVDANADRPIGPMHKLPPMPAWAESMVQSAMSPDGRMIAVATNSQLVWWNLDSATIVGTAPAPAGIYRDLWISPDNRTLLVRIATTDQFPEGLVAVDLATAATRTVATASQYVLSGDRTTVVVCRVVGDHAVLSLQRVSDGVQQGQPYSLDRSICPVEASDATGRRVVISGDFKGSGQTLQLLDLDRATVVSHATQVGDSGTDLPINDPDLVSSDGKLLIVGWLGARITYTEIPTAPSTLDVSQQVLSGDGSKMISILADGSALDVRRTTGDNSRPLAEAPRAKPYWDPASVSLRQNHGGTLVAEREGANLVSIRDASTLRQTAQVTAAMPPSVDPKVEDFSYFFDASGNLVTVSGTVVQQWDVTTGRQLAQFDTSAFHPQIDSDGSPNLYVTAYPASNQVAVVIWGDPVVRVIDLTTGRTAATLTLSDDVKGIQFDSSGRYFALLHTGGWSSCGSMTRCADRSNCCVAWYRTC